MNPSDLVNFKILALAPFCGPAETCEPKYVTDVNAVTCDKVMAELNPNFNLALPQTLCPDGDVEITLSRLQDFHPEALIQNTPFLKHLLEARDFLQQARAENLPREEIENRLNQWPDLPNFAQDLITRKPESASKSVNRILAAVDLPMEISESAKKTREDINPAETVIQKILQTIFRHPNFKSVEAAWCGLNSLLQEQAGHEHITTNIAVATHDTLQEVLDQLLPALIDNTPNLIVVDLPISNSTRDLQLLRDIASFAETLLAPALVWTSPDFFHLETWADLTKRPYLPHFLETAPYAKWQSLRQTDSANWLMVTCNCFRIRHAYGPLNKPRAVYFEETGWPWIAPVWAVADLIVQSQLKTGWPTGFTDWQRIHVACPPQQTGLNGRYPTETIFSDDRADQLIRSGITPLMGLSNQDFVCTPAETSLGGVSMGDQIYLSILIGYILKLKSSGQIDSKGEMLENDVRRALTQFLGTSIKPDAEALFVSAGPIDSNGRTPVAIKILPESTVPPLRNPIEFTLAW